MLQSAAGVTCTMACMSRAGREPGFKKQNQDNCFAFEKYITGDQALFGAFDGHGPNGETRCLKPVCGSSLPGPLQQVRCSSLIIKIKDQRRPSASCELASCPVRTLLCGRVSPARMPLQATWCLAM